ncbi:MAG: DUF169 domain-containing protein [Pseudomonadota bacterium]
MTLSGWDQAGWLEISQKLNLELPPVAVSFMIRPPEGMKKLEDVMAFCEMLKHAQEGQAFYAGTENHTCPAGPYILGKSAPPAYTSGEFGTGLKVFDHTRTMRRLYDYIPKFDAGRHINYVAFSPLDHLTFEPDLLLILAGVDQADILLRAMSYSTGKIWTSKCTPVIGCAWIYTYPYLSGEVNVITTGMGHGMKRRKVLPPGRQLLTIPYDWFATMLLNLKTMPWVLPMFQPDAEDFLRNLKADLGIDSDQ